jgi:protein-tyrosine-phosphatase
MSKTRRWSLGIWGLGLGYFIAYTPYSGLTKALSSGLWPGLTEPVSGLEMLPASVVATAVGMFGFITAMGWWKHAGRRKFLGWDLPFPGHYTFVSGLCMATIMGTTTLAFTFKGISIVFVLVLFRGGILIIAPIVDAMFKRKVHWFSWTAMLLSLAALAVTLGDVGRYQMSIVACIDVVAYLTSYFIRLRYMTRLAKSETHVTPYRYFVEEQMVAYAALLAALALLALGRGGAAMELRHGFTTFLRSPAVGGALLVGLLYATLCVFTTFIFLDRRENTFCIPMHCCSSMLSGVVASCALASFWGLAPPSIPQITGAVILIMAIACLGYPALQSLWFQTAKAQVGLARLYLFVCSGNTSRSPIAQAICNNEIARRLGLSLDQTGGFPIRALSAGLTAEPGRPFSVPAIEALQRLGVEPHAHSSRVVTPALIHQAELVFCMTEDQRQSLAARYPEAAAKIHRIDPQGDIEDPSGRDAAVFDRVSERLQQLVRQRLQIVPV